MAVRRLKPVVKDPFQRFSEEQAAILLNVSKERLRCMVGTHLTAGEPVDGPLHFLPADLALLRLLSRNDNFRSLPPEA